ncbi:MAG: hypothetical protein M3405_09680 [Acidobacteriota bacterium]|jgi:hypothetical protein|nr:hypothetical protein [Acidobacteriota bacterium]
MIELKVLNPHWLEGNENTEYDLCVHSPVWLKIGDRVVSNEESGDWTVSASAYLFLRSLDENHFSSEYEQLLPCCGFNFWNVEDKIFFSNCGTGMNWDILHKKDKIVHRFSNSEEIEIDCDEWKNAVVEFSDDVLSFYKKSKPRKFSDEESKKEFEYFMSEFKRLRKEATE